MKPMITISLTKEEATKLTKILYDVHCNVLLRDGSMDQLLNALIDLLEVEPWDL
jgi:hypothetical protein